jgi:arylsulfatase A-like enzyme/Tfp pilus assembly protein PilF
MKLTKKHIVFIFIGVLAALFILYYSLMRPLSTKEAKYISDIKKLMRPLDVSELNILFITLDTTRADRIGCYGYDKVETPNMDRLAGSGILFENATCQVPLTLPSHSSIFTGTYPFYHGVRDNGGFYLEPDKITLAEVLKENGIATSAFVGAFVLDSRWGLDQGIDYYFDNFDFSKYKIIGLDTVQREGGEVIKPFFEWFEGNYQKRFFSWIHLYDPHTPYDPPEPYKTRYSNRNWGLYDGEIAYVDELIGRVLDKLNEKSVLEKTIIVIVGDHGEMLGEHDESSHGFFIYEAATAVPLIIRFPSSKLGGKRIITSVETIDIMPTLLQILGFPMPDEVQGQSLLPLILEKNSRQEHLAYSETYYPRYHFGWSELKSLQSSQYKYILAPRPELYDIINDPQELYNIYTRETKIGKQFEQKLKSLQEEMSIEGIEEKGPQKLDEASMEKLRALGYVGGFTSSSKLNQTDNLPDPKDKIHLYNKIKMAEGQSAENKLDEALANLTEVIEEDPQIMEARHVRARLYLKLNRFEKSIDECKAALEIDPEYEAAIYTLAQAYRQLEKYEEAIAGYERLMQLDPRDNKPAHNLGDIYLKIKKIDKAIFYLQKAIDLDPEHGARTHNLLGEAYLEKKMLDQAEAAIRKAFEMNPNLAEIHYNLALIYEAKNEPIKAVNEYKKEIELYPAAYQAHFNLAQLYVKLGNLREGMEHYKQAIEHNEDFANGYLFLAKSYLDLNENLDEAMRLAKKGLELAPQSEYAPLAHYILADIYNRLGQTDKYNDELRKARQLQLKLDKNQQNNLR